MADEQSKEYKSTRGWIAGGITNIPKHLFNTYVADWWTYYRTADRDLPITQTRLIQALITVLKNRIKVLRDTETKFNEIESTYKPKVEEIYKELGGYTTEEVVNNELQMMKYGTGFDKKLKIEILGRGFSYRIPNKMPLYFPDGSVQYPMYYGRETASILATEMDELVDEIVEHAISKINGTTKPDALKNALIEQMGIVRRKAKEWIGKNMKTGEQTGEKVGDIYGIYNRWKTQLDGFNQIITSAMSELWTKIVNERMPEHVLYRHTYYKVIKQFVNKKGKMTELKPTLEFFKKPEEVDLGLDDQGMPLEVVGPEGYTFIDKQWNKSPYSCGTVLIDIFEKHDTDKSAAERAIIKIRRVDPKFVAKMELLDVVSYIHDAWDEYRDDLRDGRYHPYSMTVSDYIMAASMAVGGEWPNENKPRSIDESYTHYNMQLRGKPPWNGKIPNVRRPSNLNPAFDLRVLEKGLIGYKGEKKQWRHIGKRRYYGSDIDVCKWEQKEPMITTRGASMFIIEEICRKGKIAQEIKQDLIKTAKNVGGFDYGPRSFADQEFCMDPFNVNYEKVNDARVERLTKKKREREVHL